MIQVAGLPAYLSSHCPVLGETALVISFIICTLASFLFWDQLWARNLHLN
jgi:hypothetical protein